MAGLSTIATIVGLLSGSTGVLNFNGQLTTPQSDPDRTYVRVASGLNGGVYNTVGADGSAPRIFIANDAGQTMEYSHPTSTTFAGDLAGTVNAPNFPGWITPGSYGDYGILPEFDFRGQQATNTLFSADGPDDLCIVYTGVTFADGTKMNWVGDWAESQ